MTAPKIILIGPRELDWAQEAAYFQGVDLNECRVITVGTFEIGSDFRWVGVDHPPEGATYVMLMAPEERKGERPIAWEWDPRFADHVWPTDDLVAILIPQDVDQ